MSATLRKKQLLKGTGKMKTNPSLTLLSAACLFLPELSASEKMQSPRTLNISVIGSSTVWGSGLIGERSMAGTLDDILRDQWSDSVYPDRMRFFSGGKRIRPQIVKNRKFFRGDAARITGTGSYAEFETTGDELAVFHASARTEDYGIIGVYADGRRIGTFDNRNPTLGEMEKHFTGDGVTRVFPLGRPFTYAHEITVDSRISKTTHYNLNYVTGDVARYFPGYESVIVRAAPEKRVEHFVYFFTPPKQGSRIRIRCRYGETIGYTACTVGGTADENILESTFGIGNVPFDPANPRGFSAGLDFRRTNPGALFFHRFPNRKKRVIRLKIEGGKNPYLMIDFASNRAHMLQNAGIGGFTAARFLTDRYGRSLEDLLRDFVPDIAFIVLGGNDDWAEGKRLVRRKISGVSRKELDRMPSMQLEAVLPRKDGTFDIIRKSALIESITPHSLKSSALIGSEVKAGNFVRIGNYCGDNRSTAVRTVSRADTANGEIFWEKPLDASSILGIRSLSDLVGAEFTVRTLRDYTENIRRMTGRLLKANPGMKIILLNTYTPNYFLREVWGYAETMAQIAAENPRSVAAADASPAVWKWADAQISEKNSHTFTATGAGVYPLPWKGHAQGFRVLVGGKDEYGKTCRIHSGWYYVPQEMPDGSWKVGRTARCPRNAMKLEFTEPPAPGTPVRVLRADRRWSNDFAHPTPDGCRIIGTVAVEALRRFREK